MRMENVFSKYLHVVYSVFYLTRLERERSPVVYLKCHWAEYDKFMTTSSNGNISALQWHGALMFSLICAWINGWVNNGEAGDLRHHRTHYDVTVMFMKMINNHWTISRKIIYSQLNDNYIEFSCPRIKYFTIERLQILPKWEIVTEQRPGRYAHVSFDSPVLERTK